MRSPDHAPGVGDEYVNPGQLLGNGLGVTDDEPLVVVAGQACRIDVEAVGLHAGSGLGVLFCCFSNSS